MNIRKKTLSKLTGNTSKGLKKVALSALTFSTLSLGIGVAALAESGLTTVYYVYMDDQYIGTVSDKEIVEKAIQEKLDRSLGSNEKTMNLTIGSDLTYIPEQVFRSVSNTNDAKVKETLEQQLAVEAEGVALMIDGRAVAYVKDHKSAEQVVEQIKLKFATKEQLEQLETRKANPTLSLPPLKENESRILDVRLSKEVSMVEDTISPKDILSVEEAVNYLLKGTLEEKNYVVEVGDVLGRIANNHNMTLNQLLAINPELNAESVLKIGQVVNVTVLQPIVEVIIDKEVFAKEKVPYQKEVIEDSSLYKGDINTKQEGKDGLKEVTYTISEKNGVAIKRETLSERVLEEPVNHIVIKGTKVIASRGDGSFAWPAVGGYISSKQGSRWGRLHKGIDIARPSDRTIKAADNGKVVFAGWSSGYGNKVEIDHQNGYRTVYAHLSSISVDVGQTVEQGSKIGVMGSTGNSTGVHLHFEIYKNGSLKNPLDYIQ